MIFIYFSVCAYEEEEEYVKMNSQNSLNDSPTNLM